MSVAGASFDGLPDWFLAMLAEVDAAAIAELERALRGQLAPKPETPAERRARRLGFLARLLEETDSAIAPRSVYDAERPDDAPPSQELVDEYRLWRRVCRAAVGVGEDGRIRRENGANHTRTPGAREHTPAYSRDEILMAIRHCAIATGRVPTSRAYERWRENEVAKARRTGRQQPRIPHLTVIGRSFGRWRRALAAAAVDPRELEQARAAALPRLDRKPTTLTAHELAAVAADHLLTTRGEVDRAALDALPLSKALTLCRLLDCSLEYLAGAGDRGRAPVGTRFAHETWKERLAASGVGERQLMQQIGMPLGPYRVLLRGRHEPTLGQFKTFAAIAATHMSALLTEGETP